jgi:hypothetical protein
MNHLASMTPVKYKTLLSFEGSVKQRIFEHSSFGTTDNVVG